MTKRRSARRPTKMVVNSTDAVPIVADGAIAGPVADGRMVPLVIIDTTDRPDLDELVRLHSHLSPGDVQYHWGQVRGNKGLVALSLQFVRPIEVRAILAFNINHDGLLIDTALHSKGIYLQPGRLGDRLGHDVEKPKILVELPNDRFQDHWEGTFVRHMAEVIRKNRKVPRTEARRMAMELLDEMRRLTRLRMPPR